ncbi:uncharacterized protein ENSP00000383407 [Dama dama]
MNLFCFSLEGSMDSLYEPVPEQQAHQERSLEGKTVNDTIWQEPSKSENDSHIRRLCQLKDLNEDDFLPCHHTHTLQGKKLQGISYQAFSGA